MWQLEPSADYNARHKKYLKKNRRELKVVLNNLDTFVGTLNQGAKPIQAKFGFVHTEPKGVLAIDQKGGGRYLKQTRLYVFADEDTETVYLITLGDKNTQKEDIRFCERYVLELEKRTRDREKSEEESAKQNEIPEEE